jgi:hypothetical protein
MADVSSVPFINYAGQQADAQATQAQAGQSRAQTGLINQQTQTAAMQNQLMKARMPLIMQALSDFSDDSQGASGKDNQSGVAPTAPASSPGAAGAGVDDPNSSWYDPANADAGLRQRLFVPPVTPQEAQRIQRAALIGDQGLLESEKARRQFRVEQQTAASQYTANNGYEALSSVVDADAGNAMAQLEAIAPDTVAKIRKQLPNEADEDAAARAWAAHVAGTMHQYTGRKAERRPDGTAVDEVTGRPIPGVEKSGLSEEQWTNLAKAGVALVDMDDGQGHKVKIEQWRANQAPSLSAWVMQQAAHGGEHGAQPTVGGVPKLVATEAANNGIAKAQAANKSVNALPSSSKPGTTTTNGQPDPVMSKALGDADFNFNPPAHKFGTGLSKDEQDLKDKQADASVSLKQDMDKGVPATQQALTFYKAAQDILDSKGANTGKWNSVIAHAGAWVPGVTVPTTSNYQEMAKYLGNAALQSGKALFPKMTQKEGDWLLNKLNPSPDMNEDAVRNMLKTGVAMSQYTLDASNRVGAYLRSGKDATRFYTWVNKYWPEADAIVGKGPGSGPPTPKYSDAQIAKWAQTHNVDPGKARQFLLGSK